MSKRDDIASGPVSLGVPKGRVVLSIPKGNVLLSIPKGDVWIDTTDTLRQVIFSDELFYFADDGGVVVTDDG